MGEMLLAFSQYASLVRAIGFQPIRSLFFRRYPLLADTRRFAWALAGAQMHAFIQMSLMFPSYWMLHDLRAENKMAHCLVLFTRHTFSCFLIFLLLYKFTCVKLLVLVDRYVRTKVFGYLWDNCKT